MVIATAKSPCGDEIKVTVGAPCKDAPCQYRPTREDGRCAWHGEVHDYETTGDRGKLFNRGLCGEDEVGPRLGQLCSFNEHHAECLVGIQKREREARAALAAKRPSRHDLALGRDPA